MTECYAALRKVLQLQYHCAPGTVPRSCHPACPAPQTARMGQKLFSRTTALQAGCHMAAARASQLDQPSFSILHITCSTALCAWFSFEKRTSLFSSSAMYCCLHIIVQLISHAHHAGCLVKDLMAGVSHASKHGTRRTDSRGTDGALVANSDSSCHHGSEQVPAPCLVTFSCKILVQQLCMYVLQDVYGRHDVPLPTRCRQARRRTRRAAPP